MSSCILGCLQISIFPNLVLKSVCWSRSVLTKFWQRWWCLSRFKCFWGQDSPGLCRFLSQRTIQGSLPSPHFSQGYRSLAIFVSLWGCRHFYAQSEKWSMPSLLRYSPNESDVKTVHYAVQENEPGWTWFHCWSHGSEDWNSTRSQRAVGPRPGSILVSWGLALKNTPGSMKSFQARDMTTSIVTWSDLYADVTMRNIHIQPVNLDDLYHPSSNQLWWYPTMMM